MTASDGTATILNPGDVVLVKYLTGKKAAYKSRCNSSHLFKGHKSKAISGRTKAAFVAIDE